jgi:hypothetical protein
MSAGYVCQRCGFIAYSDDIAEVHDTCHVGEDVGLMERCGWDCWKLTMSLEHWAAWYLQLPPEQQDPPAVAMAKRWANERR